LVTAYIGLGSNLGDPQSQLRRALEALAEVPGSRLVRVSALYRSEPLGPPGQPDYLNAVAVLETTLRPLELLAALHAIEERQGRVRAERWGARTLDLDLLLYGDLALDSPALTLPHPEMINRSFVLQPLAEVAGEELHLPGIGPLRGALARRPGPPLERL